MPSPLLTSFRTVPKKFSALLWQGLKPLPFPGPISYLRRLLVLGIALPFFLLLQLLHWLGFLIDEWLYPDHRETTVQEPVFVLGVPRSGTTFTHHLLASEAEFTTLSLWECLFAPSICERKVFAALARLDSGIGRPIQRLFNVLNRWMENASGDVHPTRLDSPEEDFLTLLPTLDCFLLTVAFPEARWLWQLARGDAEHQQVDVDTVMQSYRQLLQKHLYFHGSDKRLLSKNASFAGHALALVDTFPDCRIFICERDAQGAVQSQFRSIATARWWVGTQGGNGLGGILEEELVRTLEHYYLNLEAVEQSLPAERCARIPLKQLSANTRDLLTAVNQQLKLPFGNGLDQAIAHYEAQPQATPRTGAANHYLDADRYLIEQRFARWSQAKKASNTTSEAAAPLKVAVLSDAIPGRNGVGAYYADLCAQLESHGVATLLLHPDDPAVGGLRWARFPMPGDNTQKLSVPRPLKLWRRVRDFNPDVLIAPAPGPFGFAVVDFARRLDTPVISGFHTHLEALADLYWSRWRGKASQRILNESNRVLFRNSALVLANSPDMVDKAAALGARDARLMGTSVPAELIEREPLPLAAEPRKILFAGRLAEEKNLPAVVDATRAHPELQFTIAGDGPLLDWVRQQQTELPNLQAPGWISREQLIDAMDAHDVLLLPSTVESFGTVALEGMARQRLIMVSEDCGITDWPLLAKGLHVIGRDETAAAALTRLLAMSDTERQQLAANARQGACRLNEWNVEQWIERLKAVSHRHPGTLSTLADTSPET